MKINNQKSTTNYSISDLENFKRAVIGTDDEILVLESNKEFVHSIKKFTLEQFNNKEKDLINKIAYEINAIFESIRENMIISNKPDFDQEHYIPDNDRLSFVRMYVKQLQLLLKRRDR